MIIHPATVAGNLLKRPNRRRSAPFAENQEGFSAALARFE